MSTSAAVRAPAAPGLGDVQPVAHESVDRVLTGLVTALPMLALGLAAWHAWEGVLRPSDRGTTTTTHFRRPRDTAWAAGSSTRPRW